MLRSRCPHSSALRFLRRRKRSLQYRTAATLVSQQRKAAMHLSSSPRELETQESGGVRFFQIALAASTPASVLERECSILGIPIPQLARPCFCSIPPASATPLLEDSRFS